ncbi:hypothetical protein [Sulfurimonas denitrificans]|nr:hypothetical protein [Sulfurimonas denitrificans]MDD3443597.1 hypothetical protein [Sulfurimonas denitrificans]
MYVLDALEDGEMNQSEVLSYLEKVKFLSEYKVGQKKAIKWLQVWGDKGKWIYEQRPSEKNAIFYRLESEAEKLAKVRIKTNRRAKTFLNYEYIQRIGGKICLKILKTH